MAQTRPPQPDRAEGSGDPARLARQRNRRRRRWLGLALLGAPTLWIVGSDLARRAAHIYELDGEHLLGYGASILGSWLLWAVLLHVAARRTRVIGTIVAVLFVALFTISVGTEGAFFELYDIYLSTDGQFQSQSIPWSIVGGLPFDRAFVWVHFLFAAIVAIGICMLARRFVRPRPVPRAIALGLLPVVLCGLAVVEVSFRRHQSTTAELIYFHGLTSAIRENLGWSDEALLRGQRRRPAPVGELQARPSRPRNVLLIVHEGVRWDAECVAYEESCRRPARHTNSVVPQRLPLRQMRSNSSATAIEMHVMLTGLPPTASSDALHTAPTLWHYADAAGYDTAMWTAHNVVIGQSRFLLQAIPVSHRAVGTNLDRRASAATGADDSLLTDRALADLRRLREPFFAVVQYSNTHLPFRVHPEHRPYSRASLDRGEQPRRADVYRDAVYLSNLHVARLLSELKRTDLGRRTVTIYTSDHGESFGEHDAKGHTNSIFEQEIRVPTWIDAPEGTLTREEEASLRRADNELVWHLDIAPTVLDLLGVWDDRGLTPFRAPMQGHPMTRPERTTGVVVVSNCSPIWQCKVPNYGLMQGPLKLEARSRDEGERYHCYHVLDDPNEQIDLGEEGCGELPRIARELYGAMPNAVDAPVQGPTL